MTWTPFALAVLLAGLLAVERKAFLQAGASRPLVAGALLGATLGRPAEGLAMGLALELFFLGAVNLGAALPDNELFTTSAAAGCACALAPRLDANPEAALAAAVLVALPAAKLGRWSDRLSEAVNDRVAARALEGEAAPQARLRRNLFGIWLPFLATALVCAAGIFVGAVLLPPALAGAPDRVERALTVAWASFLLVSAASALRSVRAPRAVLWAGAAFAATAAARLFSGGMGALP